jgi:hypothetical protein
MKTQIFLILTVLLSCVSSFASYCTLWNEGSWGHAGRPPVGLTCIQADGSWKNIGGFPEVPSSTAGQDSFGNSSLAEAANGDVLISYDRNKPSQTNEIAVARYNSKGGWKLVTSKPVNSEGGNLLAPATQFGAQIFELLGVPVVFWNQGDTAILSTPVGDSWRHIRFSPATDQGGFRYPQALTSADGKVSYLYYAEPVPTIWSFDSSQIALIPGPQVDSTKENTVQASLAEWNGQLVMAYSSSNTPANGGDWLKSRSKTKVALYDGTSWRNISNGIEDTAGRDHMSPFLFTVGKNLYVMYQDYSTEGVPKPDKNGVVYLDKINYRLRVKQWTGLLWRKVGGESDQANLSNRLEYLNDNGTVLINLVQKAPIGGYRQVVMSWNNGKFGYLGKQIRSFPNLNDRTTYRPGAVVRLRN